jgi:hypothetical protein
VGGGGGGGGFMNFRISRSSEMALSESSLIY